MDKKSNTIRLFSHCSKCPVFSFLAPSFSSRSRHSITVCDITNCLDDDPGQIFLFLLGSSVPNQTQSSIQAQSSDLKQSCLWPTTRTEKRHLKHIIYAHTMFLSKKGSNQKRESVTLDKSKRPMTGSNNRQRPPCKPPKELNQQSPH